MPFPIFAKVQLTDKAALAKMMNLKSEQRVILSQSIDYPKK